MLLIVLQVSTSRGPTGGMKISSPGQMVGSQRHTFVTWIKGVDARTCTRDTRQKKLQRKRPPYSFSSRWPRSLIEFGLENKSQAELDLTRCTQSVDARAVAHPERIVR